MSIFYNIFPPPKYLEMPACGLDISDRMAKFVKLKRNGGDIRVESFGSKTIPEGILASGEIKNEDGLVKFLRESLLPLDIKYIVTAMPEEKTYLSTVQLPVMDEDEIRQAAESQLPDYIPLPPNEIIFDLETDAVYSSDYERQEHLDVILSAFPLVHAQRYYDAFRKAGLFPLAFGLEAHAIARAVVPRNDPGSYLIVDFGRTRTSFIIASRGLVRFASTVAVSGINIDRALAKAFSVSLYDAEKIKKERVNLNEIKKARKEFEVVLPIVSALQGEMRRLIDFWETHSAHVHQPLAQPIKKILLCGGDANLTGIGDYFSRSLPVKTEFANVWTNVASFDDYIPEIPFYQSLTFAPAIGLALRALDS